MRFDLHLRATVLEDLQTIAGEMRTWQAQAKVGEAETEQIRQQVGSFAHCTIRTGLRVAGVDDSGDFPMLSYADSFVYLSVAQGTVYEADRLAGLKEVSPLSAPLIQFDWIPESEKTGRAALLKAFERLAGRPLDKVIQQLDYCQLKQQETGKKHSTHTNSSGWGYR